MLGLGNLHLGNEYEASYESFLRSSQCPGLPEGRHQPGLGHPDHRRLREEAVLCIPASPGKSWARGRRRRPPCQRLISGSSVAHPACSTKTRFSFANHPFLLKKSEKRPLSRHGVELAPLFLLQKQNCQSVFRKITQNLRDFSLNNA